MNLEAEISKLQKQVSILQEKVDDSPDYLMNAFCDLLWVIRFRDYYSEAEERGVVCAWSEASKKRPEWEKASPEGDYIGCYALYYDDTDDNRIISNCCCDDLHHDIISYADEGLSVPIKMRVSMCIEEDGTSTPCGIEVVDTRCGEIVYEFPNY